MDTFKAEIQFKSCSIEGCERNAHRRAGGVKGYCAAHYMRFKRHSNPLAGGTFEGEPLRFVNEVALQHAGDDCLTWPFSTNGYGYGTIRINGHYVAVHRYICELVHGAPPTIEHEAAHSCGRGHEACIAPKHVSWKTRSENQRDKLEHGTHNRGERHNMVKLTEADVIAIIGMKGNEPQSSIAAKFGVTQSNISHIHSGRRWSWLSTAAKERS